MLGRPLLCQHLPPLWSTVSPLPVRPGCSALEWILQHNYDIPNLIHYLDAFFLAGPPDSPHCGEQLYRFLRIAAALSVQVAMEKVDGPATVLVFLGLILDSLDRRSGCPPRKAAGHASRTHHMDSQAQHNQMGAPVSHWQAVICCESNGNDFTQTLGSNNWDYVIQ